MVHLPKAVSTHTLAHGNNESMPVAEGVNLKAQHGKHVKTLQPGIKGRVITCHSQ